MGWTYSQHLDGHAGPKQYLDALLTFERPCGRTKVLRSALVRMRVYYAAVEDVSDDGGRDVWAAVCLVDYNRRVRDGFIMGCKEMTEDMGPCEAECPQEIIDLLTPTESAYANEWRERCRKFNTLKAEYARKPRLKSGQLAEFESAIHMSDNSSHKTLEFVRPWPRSRRVLFRVPATGATYIVRNVRKRAYKIIVRAG
jgi:hypothetical protein